MEEKLAEKTAEYQAEMTGRGLEESRWRLLTETYREESVERLPRGDRKLQKQPESRRGSSGFHERSHREQEDAGQGETGEREAEQAEERLEAAEKSQNNDPDSQKRQRRSLSVPAAQDGRTAAGCFGTWKTGCALPHGLRKRQRFPNGSGDLCAEILSGADPAGGQQAVPGNVRRPV